MNSQVILHHPKFNDFIESGRNIFSYKPSLPNPYPLSRKVCTSKVFVAGGVWRWGRFQYLAVAEVALLSPQLPSR